MGGHVEGCLCNLEEGRERNVVLSRWVEEHARREWEWGKEGKKYEVHVKKSYWWVEEQKREMMARFPYSWIGLFWKVFPFIAIIPISFWETKASCPSAVALTHNNSLPLYSKNTLLSFYFLPITSANGIKRNFLNESNKVERETLFTFIGNL